MDSLTGLCKHGLALFLSGGALEAPPGDIFKDCLAGRPIQIVMVGKPGLVTVQPDLAATRITDDLDQAPPVTA